MLAGFALAHSYWVFVQSQALQAQISPVQLHVREPLSPRPQTRFAQARPSGEHAAPVLMPLHSVGTTPVPPVPVPPVLLPPVPPVAPPVPPVAPPVPPVAPPVPPVAPPVPPVAVSSPPGVSALEQP